MLGGESANPAVDINNDPATNKIGNVLRIFLISLLSNDCFDLLDVWIMGDQDEIQIAGTLHIINVAIGDIFINKLVVTARAPGNTVKCNPRMSG